jgi:hypothetical protein
VGPTGPAGPTGPGGPTGHTGVQGPTGNAGPIFTSVRRSGDASAELSTSVGTSVGSSAFCNFGERLLGCGFETSTIAGQLASTSASVVPDLSGNGSCQAVLRRVGEGAEAGTAGATIKAHAICAVFS